LPHWNCGVRTRKLSTRDETHLSRQFVARILIDVTQVEIRRRHGTGMRWVHVGAVYECGRKRKLSVWHRTVWHPLSPPPIISTRRVTLCK
jgi:hypothetical protein